MCAKRFGAVHGVIHAAGLATGGMIALRTAEQASEVLDPKVKGTLVLSKLLRDAPLDFFVLCSSINSVIGTVGAADYCGANAFLDALAHSADLGSVAPFVAITWDMWSEVGMGITAEVSAEQRRLREADLAAGLLSHEGVEAFDRVLASGLSHVAVSPRGVGRLEPPVVERGAGGDATLEGDVAAAGPARHARPDLSTGYVAPDGPARHARPDLSTEYVAPDGEVETAVADVLQEVLGFEQVGSHDNFFELGFDSLIAHRMVTRLRARLEMDLSVRVVLESPTLSELRQVPQGRAGGRQRRTPRRIGPKVRCLTPSSG